MQTPGKRLEECLNGIRDLSRNPKVSDLCDQVQALLSAYMETTVDVDQIIGQPVSLTKSEYRLFCILHKSMGKVVSDEAVMNAVYYDDFDSGSDGSMKIFLLRLRRSLEGSNLRIDTVRGVGLKMVAQSEPEREFFRVRNRDDVKQDATGRYATQFRFTGTEEEVFRALYDAKGALVPTATIHELAFGTPNVLHGRLPRYFTAIRAKIVNSPFLVVNEIGRGYRLVYSPQKIKTQAEVVDIGAAIEAHRVKERARMKAYRVRKKTKSEQAKAA